MDLFKELYQFSEGKIEMRAFRSDQRRQHFFGLDDFDKITKWLSRHRDWNCFHAVGTRKDSSNGSLENVLQVPAAWTDIDFKDIAKRTAWELIKSFEYEPSALIASGNGAHVYWIFKEPSESNDFDSLVNILLRLADYFGGDHAACDVARVLRTPGSLNHKYTPPRDVKVIYIKSHRYELTDLQGILPESKYKHRKTRGSSNPEGWLLKALKGVEKHNPGRNHTGVKIAGYFIDKLPQKDVLTLLLAWNIHNDPPLQEAEIRKIVNSVIRYKRGRARRNETGSPRFEFPVG